MKYLGRFGKDHLYNTWKAACRNFGIENVDLYGGPGTHDAGGDPAICD